MKSKITNNNTLISKYLSSVSNKNRSRLSSTNPSKEIRDELKPKDILIISIY